MDGSQLTWREGGAGAGQNPPPRALHLRITVQQKGRAKGKEATVREEGETPGRQVEGGALIQGKEAEQATGMKISLEMQRPGLEGSLEIHEWNILHTASPCHTTSTVPIHKSSLKSEVLPTSLSLVHPTCPWQFRPNDDTKY